jgi:hypothetical protein
MITTVDCDAFAEQVAAFVEGSLSENEHKAAQEHLDTCASCRDGLKQFRAVKGLAEFVQLQRSYETVESNPPAAQTVSIAVPFLQRIGAAPWWFVSLSFHVLIIALASLISMSIELQNGDDSVIMVTELQPRAAAVQETAKPKTAETEALDKNETPPTDLNSKESSEIVVPPDILAQAQLGDHFETVNPDREDMHSAYGNDESKMFHSIQGDASPAGGGGNGGVGLDELIGVGGATSVGTGGGWGGGNGTGTGVGAGAGHGSFGNRNGGGRQLMVKRHGGSIATENAVNRALEWLAYHQEPDGHWDARKFGAEYSVDAGMTGLALLAFLGAGHTEKCGHYKDNVQRAVAWIKKQQQPDGSISEAYQIPICTLALSEAAGMANIPDTRAAAQKAVNYCIEIHQNGDGSEKRAWRYHKKSPTEDISVSGWFVMALKSAKVAGLSVDPASFEGAMKFLDTCELKNCAPHGVDTAYGPPSRYLYQPPLNQKGAHDMNGGDTPWGHARTTAIGLLCRQFMGVNKDTLQSSVDLMIELGGVPQWTNDKLADHDHSFLTGKTDLYYWYYGTLCTFQQGGDAWKKWNAGLKKALTENQCKGGGDDDGSWNPVGCFASDWGRVGQTALGALCLEVYYRYARLNQEAK